MLTDSLYLNGRYVSITIRVDAMMESSEKQKLFNELDWLGALCIEKIPNGKEVTIINGTCTNDGNLAACADCVYRRYPDEYYNIPPEQQKKKRTRQATCLATRVLGYDMYQLIVPVDFKERVFKYGSDIAIESIGATFSLKQEYFNNLPSKWTPRLKPPIKKLQYENTNVIWFTSVAGHIRAYKPIIKMGYLKGGF